MRYDFGLAMLMLLSVPTAAKAICTLSALSVSFGTYNPTTSDDSAGQVTVSRNPGTNNCSYSIALSQGSSGTYVPRYLKNGNSSLSYQLYTDSSHTTVWSNTNTVSDSGVVSGGSNSHAVYARIFSQQFLAPGTYTDTITATAAGITNPTATFSVTATISTLCTISVSALGFGTYIGKQTDAAATLSVTCSNTTPYNIGLSAGNATGATVTTRRMQGRDSNGLKYALFRDSGRTQNWGNTVGTDTVAGTGSGNAQSLTVYGRIATGQLIAPANYNDTIVATITY